MPADDGGVFFIAALFWAIVFGFAGHAIDRSRGGGGGFGAFLGVLLGPIGLLIAVARTPEQRPADLRALRECPHCKETMRRDASVCPHCQRESPAWEFRDGRWWTNGQWFDERLRVWVRPSG